MAVAGLANWRLATDGRHKLVLDSARGPLLFDRDADPLEEHNLAATRREVVDRLRMHLA